ncbi:MAG: hypothetical protein A2096_01450, partial [Spirochaetes bacterium GWF1_41_5]
MKPREIDNSIADLEKLLKLSITVVDRYGCFHNEKGDTILSHSLFHTHQNNEVCRLGFCHKCIEHCRHEMNAMGEKIKTSFVHTCWKGLSEIVIPLFDENIHFGSLFAGIWKNTEKTPVRSKILPAGFFRSREKLLPIETVNTGAMKNVLEIYARGLLALLTGKVPFCPADSKRSIIKNFLFKKASGKINLPELAEKLGLSVSRTSHLVKSLFGKSFQELLMEERIKRAKTLLKSTECTIREIAELAGFTDAY